MRLLSFCSLFAYFNKDEDYHSEELLSKGVPNIQHKDENHHSGISVLLRLSY